jgi:large subunit ribosomal protein L6
MKNLSKNKIIKIPNTIKIFYCDKTHILLIKGPLSYKLLKLNVKIIVLNNPNIIKVTNIICNKLLKKNNQSLQGTLVALIKQTFFEVSTVLCKKIQLIGVGFKVFSLKINNLNLVHLKLGYSHSIYFKIPENIRVENHKSTILFISGNSFNYVTQIAALIKSYKFPEIYKGKGILYADEKIKLKEGKKI